MPDPGIDGLAAFSVLLLLVCDIVVRKCRLFPNQPWQKQLLLP